MKHKSIEKQFWSYVLPSMLTMLLGGFYAIVDGFFVGRAIGDVGLAAINLAWPIQALLNSVGVGVGIGGSVVMSMRNGAGDSTGAAKARGNTIVMLVGLAVVLTCLLSVFASPILYFLGAQGEIHAAAMDYIRIIVSAAMLPVLGNGLTPLLRNGGRTIAATVIMVCGLLINIILDAVFIFSFGLGMKGAALATITAQGFVALMSSIIVLFDRVNRLHKEHLKPEGATIRELLCIGVSPFGLTLAPSLIIVIANWQCIRYGGDLAVAAFSVVSYVVASVQALLQGVGDGVQPVISFCKGAQHWDNLHIARRKALALTIGLSLLLSVAVILSQDILPAMFGLSEQAAIITKTALAISACSFPFLGLSRLASAYFYAVGQSRCSTLLVYLDPILITPLLILMLPFFLRLEGVWIALSAAQLILSLVAAYLLRKTVVSEDF